jgi:hypothetical protein
MVPRKGSALYGATWLKIEDFHPEREEFFAFTREKNVPRKRILFRATWSNNKPLLPVSPKARAPISRHNILRMNRQEFLYVQ